MYFFPEHCGIGVNETGINDLVLHHVSNDLVLQSFALHISYDGFPGTLFGNYGHHCEWCWIHLMSFVFFSLCSLLLLTLVTYCLVLS